MATILIVENDELIREMLSRRLQRRGFDVVTAGDGRQAIAAVGKHRPALVLMDLSLPVMDGWTAARALKDAPETASVPIIALTAHAMAGDRERALEAGCDDYDTKPIDFERLLDKVSRFVK